jgi:hypothetical protein
MVLSRILDNLISICERQRLLYFYWLERHLLNIALNMKKKRSVTAENFQGVLFTDFRYVNIIHDTHALQLKPST